ncbi:MAG: IS21 family transposase, partial [Acidithiobacillus sp.]
MFTIRQILVRMRQGDRDREIARSRLMGRKKLGALRNQAAQHGWLDPQQPLPDDCALAILQQHRQQAVPTQCVSTLKDHEEQIAKWAAEGIQGTTIHAALVRNHGYTGSYSAVRRVLLRVAPVKAPDATMRLIFAPGEAAQVDFGAGPAMIDPVTGEIRKTWFFV